MSNKQSNSTAAAGSMQVCLLGLENVNILEEF